MCVFPTAFGQGACVICFWSFRPLRSMWRSQGCQSPFGPVNFWVPRLEPLQAQDLAVRLDWDD